MPTCFVANSKMPRAACVAQVIATPVAIARRAGDASALRARSSTVPIPRNSAALRRARSKAGSELSICQIHKINWGTNIQRHASAKNITPAVRATTRNDKFMSHAPAIWLNGLGNYFSGELKRSTS